MSRTLSVDGLSLVVAEAPAAAEPRPPVLFVHGMFGGAWQFDGWQRLFAGHGWTSYALDLRGHHASRAVPDLGRLSVHDYVQDALAAAAFLDGRHGSKPVVIGHSMGGLITQKVAEAGAALAAVLLCAAPPRGIPVIGATLLRRMVRHVPALLGSRELVMSREDDDALALNRVPLAERAELHARSVPESGRAGREMALGIVGVDARRVLCPLVSVSGSDDRFVPSRVGRALARKYHAPWWRYPDHAHFLIAEPGWERIASDVERWAAHVTQRATQPERDESLWKELKSSIGDLVELEFFDGYRVRAEIISVDLAARHRFVYDPVETRAPGARARYSTRTADDDVEWSPLVELVGLQPLPHM